jgi:hypothetical protein
MTFGELMGKLVFIVDSRFHGNDTNVIVVIPAEAGVHPNYSIPSLLLHSSRMSTVLVAPIRATPTDLTSIA